MKQFLIPGILSVGLLLTACQDDSLPIKSVDESQDNPLSAAETAELSEILAYPTVASDPIEATEGRPMTEIEIAAVLSSPSELEDINVLDYAPNLPETSSGLAKSSAAQNCVINFDNTDALSWIPEQAWNTFVVAPFYIQPCGSDYYVYTRPRNMNHYHLGFEFLRSGYGFCLGDPYQTGILANGHCFGLKDAKLHRRTASNMQSGSGIEFYAKGDYGSTSKLFDLKRLTIHSGPAKIVVYRTDVNKWWKWTLNAGTWNFPLNSTKLKYLRVYHKDYDGIFEIDDIEISIRS